MAEYEAKFTELPRFVPEYIGTEVKKTRRIQPERDRECGPGR
jgi:hypothetical protein